MFKRITPQTIADWGERIYIRFLELTKRFTSTQIMALLAVIVGVLAGLGTCLFELLLYGIKAGLTHWFPVEQSHFLFLFYPVIGIILASLFVKYVVKDNISEGVTRVLYAMSRKNSYIAPHNCWTSVVGGATTIGFGGSVGPEAPIVLTGAAIGSNVSRLAHLNYKNTTLLLCCGAGAALAAIFKAPITGVVFVLEILMLDLTSRTVVPLLISSITAAAIALTIRGFDPIIAISLTPDDAFRLMLVLFAAVTSSIALTESAVSTFEDELHWNRKKSTVVIGIIMLALGTLSSLGYGPLDAVKILGMQFLDFFDFLTNSVMMPIAAIATCLLVSRVIGVDRIEEEMTQEGGTFRRKKIFVMMIKYLCPVFAAIILISSVMNAFGLISM